jgi:hypothetical protein
MSKTRVFVWIAAVVAAAAIACYFAFVYEKADYKHPMVRSGSTGIR